MEALLAQKRWRRGKRGRWYERRALILSTHFPKDEETTERALNAVIEALLDPDTHIGKICNVDGFRECSKCSVCRPKLQRRLRRLENKLKIPVKERHICDGIIVDADEIVFEAVRLRHRAASLKLDRTGRCINAHASQQGNQDIKRYYSLVTTVKQEHSSSVAHPSRRESSVRLPARRTCRGSSLWCSQMCRKEKVSGWVGMARN